jgi:hypothetical protein
VRGHPPQERGVLAEHHDRLALFDDLLGQLDEPVEWTAPLNDTLKAAVVGYDPIAISECARRSVALARKTLGF